MSGTNECLTKTKPCGCRIMAITPAFQAGDVGSIPIIRFKTTDFISSFFLLKSNYKKIIPPKYSNNDGINIYLNKENNFSSTTHLNTKILCKF